MPNLANGAFLQKHFHDIKAEFNRRAMEQLEIVEGSAR